MRTAAVPLAVVALACLEACALSLGDVLRADRPLTASEIARVLRAARDALAGTTWTLEPGTGRPGMEVRMAPGGLPRAIRYTLETEGGFVTGEPGRRSRDVSTSRVTTLIDYAGRPGRRCAGGGPVGELVIEYSRAGTNDAWTARARRRTRVDVGLPGVVPFFELLQGQGRITSGARQLVAGRPALALIAPYAPPGAPGGYAPERIGDPPPNVVGEPAAGGNVEPGRQTLWIDVESLRPLRWELSERGQTTFGYDIVHAPIDLQPPTGVTQPQCFD